MNNMPRSDDDNDDSMAALVVVLALIALGVGAFAMIYIFRPDWLGRGTSTRPPTTVAVSTPAPSTLLPSLSPSSAPVGQIPGPAPPQKPLPATLQDGAFIQGSINNAANGATVRIPAGFYQLPGRITINGKSRLTIAGAGEGVTVLVGPNKDEGVFLFDRCTGVKVTGLTITRAVPPFSQARVTSAESANALVVEVLPGYKTEVLSQLRADQPVSIFNPTTLTFKRGAPDLYPTGSSSTGGRSFRVTFNGNADKAAVGDLLTFRGPFAPDVSMYASETCSLENVTITNGTGLVILENGGKGGHIYKKLTICRAAAPAGATMPPLLSSNLDGIHSASTEKGPQIDQCIIERCHDDAIAIHGTTTRVTGTGNGGGNELIGTTKYDWAEPQVGDTVAILDANTGLKGDAKVQAKRDAGNGAKGYTLTNTFGAQSGWFLEPEERMGKGYTVTNTYIFENRARGMLLKAHNGTVRNNKVERSTISGIVLAPEQTEWSESSYSRNCIVENNIIDGTGYATWVDANQAYAGAISIASPDGRNATNPAHRGIVIQRNTIKNVDGIQISVANASTVTIANNKTESEGSLFGRGSGWTGNASKSIFVSPNCNQVTLKNNLVKRA